MQRNLTQEEINQILLEQYKLIREKTISIITEFNKKLVERDEVIPLLILALYCRQNVLLFGEAGVSKTRMMLLLASLTGYKDYNINIAEITSPAEMIGTVEDMENEELRSIVNCQIALIDEIFKARQNGLLHSLLNIIREKVVTLGGKVKNLDLKMVIGSSNEFGTHKSLIPFNDRFPLKCIVQRIQSEDNFLKYWNEEYEKDFIFERHTSDEEIDKIISFSKKIKEEPIVTKFIMQLRNEILRNKLQFSDRAFGDSKTILKVSAILNGRDTINISDIFLFKYMGWVEEDSMKRLWKIINEIVFGNKNELLKLQNNFDKEVQKVDDRIQGKIERTLNYDFEIHSHDTFNSIKKILVDIKESYIELLDFLETQIHRRRIHHSFEIELKRNLFLKNYKDTVFDATILNKMRKSRQYIIRQINILESWLTRNTSSPVYLQNIAANK